MAGASEAAVLKVLPCPAIQGGEGQVVTGTFRHTCDSLVELHIEGEPEPVVCTSGHPIWRQDREAFVRADQLFHNEHLSYLGANPTSIRKTVFINSGQPVYNFEVERNHTYFVGHAGMLVHNAGGMRQQGARNLFMLGIQGIDLSNENFNSGRKKLEAAGFVYVGKANSGRHKFEHPALRTKLSFDSKGALAFGQKNHWHIRYDDRHFDSKGRDRTGDNRRHIRTCR